MISRTKIKGKQNDNRKRRFSRTGASKQFPGLRKIDLGNILSAALLYTFAILPLFHPRGLPSPWHRATEKPVL